MKIDQFYILHRWRILFPQAEDATDNDGFEPQTLFWELGMAQVIGPVKLEGPLNPKGQLSHWCATLAPHSHMLRSSFWPETVWRGPAALGGRGVGQTSPPRSPKQIPKLEGFGHQSSACILMASDEGPQSPRFYRLSHRGPNTFSTLVRLA